MFNPFSIFGIKDKLLGGIALGAVTLAIAAGTFAAIQTVRIEGLHFLIVNIEGYSAANARLKADLESIKRGQMEAQAKQEQRDRDDLAAQIILSNRVEQAHAETEAARVTAVRVCRTQAAGGASGRSSPAGVPGDPGQPAPEPEAADMVAVTRPDFDALTSEAVRGAERFRYLEALIMEGRAIRASDIPQPELSVQP
jgi:hypothetical protein